MSRTTAATDHASAEPRGAANRFERGAPGYPAAHLDLPDPPACWYVRGRWPVAGPAVAIVGSRAASAYGRAVARRLAFDLAGQGVVVVSGLARGVDAAAHAGALEAGGATLAVLPGGIDRVVPESHAALAGAMLERGAWVSERPGAAPPFRGRFLERNRLIAALCAAVVVVEAAPRSGALTTAAHARRLGRTLFAVPGDVHRETSRGCHMLLRRGASLAEHAGDVLRAMERAGDPEDELARLRAALDERPRALEALARDAGVTPRAAAALLARLALAGFAASAPGQRWVRTG
jgi:DNA processing protein